MKQLNAAKPDMIIVYGFQSVINPYIIAATEANNNKKLGRYSAKITFYLFSFGVGI